MKKLLMFLVIIMVSCSDEQQGSIDESIAIAEEQGTLKRCATTEVLQQNIEKDPSLTARMQQIERNTKDAVDLGLTNRIGADGVLEIPVVFHVIYSDNNSNTPLSRLQDQVDILNEDFNLQNPGRNSIPNEFKSVEGDIDIRFVLESVTRTFNNATYWEPDDSMKFTSQGGKDVETPQDYLNIWVVNDMRFRSRGQWYTILGYAQFPGGSWNTDGVVLHNAFTGYTQYGSGRTASHEVGHWLNLRHIWADDSSKRRTICQGSDFVADTPNQGGPSRGCPSYPTSSCGTNDMTMNFMDYSDDDCLNMFTIGQSTRMRANFASNGFRSQMGQ